MSTTSLDVVRQVNKKLDTINKEHVRAESNEAAALNVLKRSLEELAEKGLDLRSTLEEKGIDGLKSILLKEQEKETARLESQVEGAEQLIEAYSQNDYGLMRTLLGVKDSTPQEVESAETASEPVKVEVEDADEVAAQEHAAEVPELEDEVPEPEPEDEPEVPEPEVPESEDEPEVAEVVTEKKPALSFDEDDDDDDGPDEFTFDKDEDEPVSLTMSDLDDKASDENSKPKSPKKAAPLNFDEDDDEDDENLPDFSKLLKSSGGSF